MFDFFFYYKYVIRFILSLKKSKTSFKSTNILKLEKVIVFFDLKNIIDINNLSISNYYFFFKYFFGKIPFFYNYKYVFKLNVNYYNFFIMYNFKKKEIYYILYFFINDIYFNISKNLINVNKIDNYWNFIINDMNFFIEKKNSIGFFYLKDNVNFRFILKNNNELDYYNYFINYKL